MKRDLTPEEREEIRNLIAEGLTFWEVAHQYPHRRTHDLRTAWRQLRRDHRLNGWVPPPQEMEWLKEEVRKAWCPRDWSQRWVGRFANAREEDLQSSASKLMPY
jgi:hypothetical protein